MPAAPTCPRCGYDLTGLVAAWVESCPLASRCTECGLDFSCANVLSPRLIGPGWSYEHAQLNETRRFWRTSWAALRPWEMWTQFHVDHAIRPRRAARFGARWLLGTHLALVAATGASWALGSALGGGSVSYWAGRAYLDPWPILLWLIAPYAHQVRWPVGGGSVGFPVLPPLLLAMVPTVLMPAWMIILGDTFAAARVRRIHLLRGFAYAIPGAVIWSLLSIALIVAGAVIASGSPATTRLLVPGGLLLLIAFPLYHALWWYLFIRTYLRLRHAAMTVLLFVVMSALILALGVLYYQQWRGW